MLDKHHRYHSDENTAIEMLYRGKDIEKSEFINSEDIQLYNKFSAEFDLNRLKILGEDDFDRINTYNIPQHYKDLDVEEYVKRLVPNTEDQTDKLAHLKRVEMELALYKERNLYSVLQVLIYIVDVLRKNNLVWGVGRGSSVASYVLYLIGIHKVDSLKFNLDIREFLKR